MEEPGDLTMGEDVVMGTTEMNGQNSYNHSVYRPDNLFLHGKPQVPISSDALTSLRAMKPGMEKQAEDTEMSNSNMSNDSSASTEDSLETTEGYVPQLYHPKIVIEALKPKANFLPYVTKRSGLVYDVRMRYHTEPMTPGDDEFHPEDPRRIYAIYSRLKEGGLVEDDQDDRQNQSMEKNFKLHLIPVREASKSEICLIHTEEHYEWVRALYGMTEDELQKQAEGMDSIYLHKMTFLCASLAAGGAIDACKAVVAGAVKNAIAVIRPPGHHAEHDKPGGFCFFNNVCVAARVCQLDFPEKCRKILILDWDVHHGNGVQEVFYADPNVLYISIHVHRNGTFYPAGNFGDHLHCGEGAGLGFNVNIPWADHNMGDGDYLYAFQQIVMPIAQEFDPQLVIVSAGFDAAEGDKLGGCHVSPQCFAHMTHMLMSLAEGKIVVCLEGGYNLDSIAKSAFAVTRTLLGEPPDRLPQNPPVPSAIGISTVQLVIRQQSRYWKCMFPKDQKRHGNTNSSESLQSVIRSHQSKILFEQYRMSQLCVNRQSLSKSFNDQILATPNYANSELLLVIFHDPPEVLGTADAFYNRVDLQRSYLSDGTKAYIDWANSNKFAVIDVNVPDLGNQHSPGLSYNDLTMGVHDPTELRAIRLKELVMYLWENYIECYDASHIFFMGVGFAYSAVVSLLSEIIRGTEDDYRIKCAMSFVSRSSLQSVKNPANDNLPRWYSQHSMVFVAPGHAVWEPERNRKAGKKYGRLIKSESTDLEEMMSEHYNEVIARLQMDTRLWRENENRKQIRDAARKLEDADAKSPIRNSGKLPPMGAFVVSSPSRKS